MGKTSAQSQQSLQVEYDKKMYGIGLPPTLVLNMDTGYGKIIAIDRPAPAQSLSARIVPVPATYHDRSVVVLPQQWEKLYEIEEKRLVCKLIEPDFCKNIKLKTIPTEEENELPAVGEIIADKSIVFEGKFVRESNSIFKIESLDSDNSHAIATNRTSLEIIPLESDPDTENEKYSVGSDKRQLDSPETNTKFAGDFTSAEQISYKNLNKVKGIDDAIRRIKEEVIYPFAQILTGKTSNPKPLGGVMLYGPPGCGKTEICHSVAKDLGIKFVNVKIGDLASKHHHQFAKNLKKKFEIAAKSDKGAIVFLDEIDAMAGPRNELLQAHDKENVNALLQELDPKNRDPKVLVFAATNFLSSLDTAVTRSGRFDTKIPIPPPDEDGRAAILRSKINELSIDSDSITEGVVKELARETIGHVGADLETLVNKAETFRTTRSLQDEGSSDSLPMQKQDLLKAIDAVTPLCETSMDITQPSIKTEDLPGSEHYVQKICEEAEYMFNPEKFRGDISYQPNQAFLLHGPPGTGKTSIANAVANKLNILFKVVDAGENKDMWVGNTIKNINKIFENARLFRPILVFLDEIDSIAHTRSSSEFSNSSDSINTLLTQFGDGVDNDNIIFIGATNRKDIIDPALLRPGRFGTHIEVGTPEKPAIKKQFITMVEEEISHSLTKAELNEIVESLSNLNVTQADIAAFVNTVKRELVFTTAEGDEADIDFFKRVLPKTKTDD